MNTLTKIVELTKNKAAVFTGLSLVGVIATFWQTAEKIQLLKYPNEPLSCNINPIVDCGTVLNHNLSAATGVPNSLVGLVFFVLFLTVGILRLLSVDLNDRAKKMIFALSLIMFAFSIWFFAASLYIITKICIFCIFIWSSAIPIFFLSLSDLQIPNGFKLQSLQNHPYRASVIVLLTMTALFLIKFQEYYFG